jgi:hypothetical protein
MTEKPCVFSYVLQLTLRNKLQASGIELLGIMLGDRGRGWVEMLGSQDLISPAYTDFT